MIPATVDIASGVKGAEVERLAELAKGRIVLEVGSWRGFSTVVMGRTAALVHAVDWHRGDAHAGVGDTLCEFWANLGRYKVRDKVIVHVGSAEAILPLFRPASFDFAFLDAFHSAEAVERHAALILPLLRPGALLAFHDYGDPRFQVAKAVDGLGMPIIELTRTLAVVAA